MTEIRTPEQLGKLLAEECPLDLVLAGGDYRSTPGDDCGDHADVYDQIHVARRIREIVMSCDPQKEIDGPCGEHPHHDIPDGEWRADYDWCQRCGRSWG